MAEYRTAIEAIFEEEAIERVLVYVYETENEGRFYVHIKQGSDDVAIPLAEFKEFASKLNLWAIDNG